LKLNNNGKAVKIQRVSKVSKQMYQMKAQIFLSCGQNPDYDEPRFVQLIKDKIISLGFDEPYVAVHIQSPRSIRENVFKQMQESDYFLLIDFKREELGKDKDGQLIHRGSLFTNQELALASFLEMEMMLFQEAGVRQRDGMLDAIQGNATPFSDRNKLPDLIAEEIRRRVWTTETRNTLALSVYPNSASRLDQTKSDGRFSRPFHIKVDNLHHRKDARNCFAYLDEVVDLNSNRSISKNEKWETVEFKWAGTRLASVRIAPKPSYRNFDAVWLFVNQQQQIGMGFFDSVVPALTDYFPHQLRPGRYRLTFVVVSDNFSPVRKNFIFEFGQTLESGKLSEET
jgi:hypothetical protein